VGGVPRSQGVNVLYAARRWLRSAKRKRGSPGRRGRAATALLSYGPQRRCWDMTAAIQMQVHVQVGLTFSGEWRDALFYPPSLVQAGPVAS